MYEPHELYAKIHIMLSAHLQTENKITNSEVQKQSFINLYLFFMLIQKIDILIINIQCFFLFFFYKRNNRLFIII